MDLRFSCTRIHDRSKFWPPENPIYKLKFTKSKSYVFQHLWPLKLLKTTNNSTLPNMDLQSSCAQVFICFCELAENVTFCIGSTLGDFRTRFHINSTRVICRENSQCQISKAKPRLDINQFRAQISSSVFALKWSGKIAINLFCRIFTLNWIKIVHLLRGGIK